MALQKVVDRHEILRTTFHHLPGMTLPVQVISGHSMDYSPLLSSGAPAEQESTIEVLFHQASQLPFDFEQGPLLRASLVTLSSHRYVLFASLPALCLDIEGLKILTLKSAVLMPHACVARDNPMNRCNMPISLNGRMTYLKQRIQKQEGPIRHKQELSTFHTLKLPFENHPSGKPVFEPQYLTLTIPSETAAKIETMAQQYGTPVAGFSWPAGRFCSGVSPDKPTS